MNFLYLNIFLINFINKTFSLGFSAMQNEIRDHDFPEKNNKKNVKNALYILKFAE